jgi:hypothetical protein
MTPAQLADELARIDKLDRLANRAAERFHETPHYADLRNGGMMRHKQKYFNLGTGDVFPDEEWVWRPSVWVWMLAAAMAVGIVAAIWKGWQWMI